jgi:hypothetical protein
MYFTFISSSENKFNQTNEIQLASFQVISFPLYLL